MSLQRALAACKTAQLSDNDRTWFPKWLARYASWNRILPAAPLPIQQELLIQFLRSIKAQGKPAWQRLQAVRAVAFYASHVLHQPAPWITNIAARLDDAARAEHSHSVVHDNPETEFCSAAPVACKARSIGSEGTARPEVWVAFYREDTRNAKVAIAS